MVWNTLFEEMCNFFLVKQAIFSLSIDVVNFMKMAQIGNKKIRTFCFWLFWNLKLNRKCLKHGDEHLKCQCGCCWLGRVIFLKDDQVNSPNWATDDNSNRKERCWREGSISAWEGSIYKALHLTLWGEELGNPGLRFAFWTTLVLNSKPLPTRNFWV